jgi:DNA polymerase-3 subunit beta
MLQSNLSKVLGQTSKIVGNRTTLPVLSNILIQSQKGKIKFSATDLEVGITTAAIGKIDEEGEITLPARLLSDFIANNKDESIEITTAGTIATLKSSHYEATIHGIDAAEFPTIPEAPKAYFAKISRQVFLESLRKVNIAPANDETRPVLAGIFMQFDGKTLILAATDSYRLAEKKITLEEAVEEKKLVVPSRTMGEVLRILSSADGIEDISLASTDNQISFKIGDTFIVSRIIEGTFPNYTQIIPSSSKIRAKVKLSELASAVKMSFLFAKDSANNNVKMMVKENEVSIISSASQAGSSKSAISAETSGGEIEIAFNARYILDVLNVLSDEYVVMEFNTSLVAGVVRPEKDDDYLYIMMPLKLEN